jgi:hypothetical protein
MPEGSDERELRALQRKAYARDGGLTADEARRLREIDEARRRAPEPVSDAGATPQHESRDAPHGDVVPDTGSAAPVPGEPTPAEPVRSAVRRNIVGAVAAAVVLLAVGAAAGWALFAPHGEAVALTPAQEERRIELASDYDPDSVRAMGKNDDALAWYATQDSGETACLILDVAGVSQSTCVPRSEVEFGASVAIPLPVMTAAGTEDDTAEVENVVATLLLSLQGEPMVGIERWSMSSSLLTQFEGEQRVRAEELLAEGYDLGLTIVGFFREEPVWLGDRLSAEGVTLKCLIVDADDAVECAPITDAIEQGLDAQVADVDQVSGDVIAVSVLEVAFTRWQTPYLTVTAGAVVSGVKPGESFLVQTGPPGDPIRVDIPGRDQGD